MNCTVPLKSDIYYEKTKKNLQDPGLIQWFNISRISIIKSRKLIKDKMRKYGRYMNYPVPVIQTFIMIRQKDREDP